jgi:pimeloyl-ACP methyl ester carboxylesterase
MRSVGPGLQSYSSWEPPGTADTFDQLADLLADEFTVITYDRRGNGRSPAPAGWTTTSPEEQADDAAALLEALGVGPAAVFGTSSGGNFALHLLIRHSDAIRGAILHEPGLYAVLDDFEAVRAPVRAIVAGAMQAGGPSVAVEAFWGYIAGENAWDQLSAELRERLRATAATLFSIELGTYDPNPRVSGESIFGLAWRSFSGGFRVARRSGARVSPRVAGLR